MKVYMGFRLEGKCHVYVWDTSAPAKPERVGMLGAAEGLTCDGPDWGYMGSGPAALAYTLVNRVTLSTGIALESFEYVHEMITARLPKDCWAVTAERLLEVIAKWQHQLGTEILLPDDVDDDQSSLII